MTTTSASVEGERDPPAPRPLHQVAVESGSAWLLGFAPTVYLALSGGGGYDIVARSEIGILFWWVVLLGAIVGVLPRRPWRAPVWIAVALLSAFFGWTWVAAGWSQSEQQ